MQTVLVVDDQLAARRLLAHALEPSYRVLEAADGAAALRLLSASSVDAVILDLHLPPDAESAAEGLRVQRALAEREPLLPVVILTGDQDHGLALEMVRRGVADFLLKPIDPTVMRIVVARALERGRLERELRELRERLRERSGFGQLVGQSLAMRQAFARLERLAEVPTTVLLLGESGTGKSAVARALHERGPRAGKPFVVVDGATIPESLMESELFGHARGAYTGADAPRRGRIQAADGGTLLLDEIGNLSAAAQAKLLLFLDDRACTPVGSNEPVRVDVRLVVATNRNLAAMVRQGTFREDMFFRLQVATVRLPPLRERREDIAPLAEYLLARLAREVGRPGARLTRRAIELLACYPWPGNVRQLKHVLESSLVLASGETLDAGDLVLPALEAGAAEGQTEDVEAGAGGSFKEQMARHERRVLGDALARCHGNKAAAGRLLGLDKNQIHYLCKKLGMG